MKNLANALMKNKSYKERQECLSESIDRLSFNYPDLYILFYREMKKREVESNDPNKIYKWLSSSNSYVKLHKALILVKSNNSVAKEEYQDILKQMLYQTIENKTNIDISVKICRLVEKSAHLSSIHDHLKYLIQQVYQLNDNKYDICMKLQPNYLWQNSFRHIQDDPFERLNNQRDQLQHTTVRPTILKPSHVKPNNSFPNFNLDYYGYDGNRCSTIDFSQSLFNLTILDQDMDGAFAKWLQFLKLHKYQWFFNGLSYLEIECINEDNIEGFVAKVNKNAITKGAQKKICISTKILRNRRQKLDDLLMSLDLEVTPNELCEFTTYMREILHYPIPNKNCIVGYQLQQDLTRVMEKLLNQLLEKLGKTKFLVSQSLIGTTINIFLECTMLITRNQVFMKEQVDKTVIFATMLKSKVRQMPKNFN